MVLVTLGIRNKKGQYKDYAVDFHPNLTQYLH